MTEKLLPTFKNIILSAMKIVKDPKHLYLLQQAYRRILIHPALVQNYYYSRDLDVIHMLNTEPDSPYKGKCLDVPSYIVCNGSGVHLDIFGDESYYVEIGITRKNVYSKTEFHNYRTFDGQLVPKVVGEILKPRVTLGYRGDVSEYGYRNAGRWTETVAGWPKLSKYIKATVVSSHIDCNQHLPENICRRKEERARKDERGYHYSNRYGDRWLETDHITSERKILFVDTFKDCDVPDFKQDGVLLLDIGLRHVSCQPPDDVYFVRTKDDFSIPEFIKASHSY